MMGENSKEGMFWQTGTRITVYSQGWGRFERLSIIKLKHLSLSF